MGSYTDAGSRGDAPLWIQPRCRSHLEGISQHGEGELSTRQDDPREIQRGAPHNRGGCFGGILGKRNWFRLDEWNLSCIAARVAEESAGRAGVIATSHKSTPLFY